MNKLIAISIVVINGLFSCNSSKQEEATTIASKVNLLDTAKWFIGTWQNQTSDGLFTEQWDQKNDSVYSAISTVIVNKDTVFYESISLEQKDDSLYYIVSVKDQNKELPVSFKLISVTDNQLVFENAKHDFPSKITYSKIKEDSVVAFISGLIDGKEKIEQFPMKKIK
ncbi:MAG: hypothetical protein IPL10_06630 [Bacteroidetes bacterium]|nr:hypothetical protein [Bacteroidota bacterium]